MANGSSSCSEGGVQERGKAHSHVPGMNMAPGKKRQEKTIRVCKENFVEVGFL